MTKSTKVGTGNKASALFFYSAGVESRSFYLNLCPLNMVFIPLKEYSL